MSDEPDDPTAPPDWQLPQGVNAALWHYTRSERLAREEDGYFADHPLFEADRRILDERLTTPGRLIDLGCGTGRHSVRFAARGFRVVAVELSAAMLRAVDRKARDEGVEVATLQANLCDLRALPDGSFEYGISMFSTLGMIRGVSARRQALREAFRVLRPGGRLALHVHNLWLNLHDPQGRRWLAGELLRALGRPGDLGDRTMTYRGIPGMQVHLYRWGELSADLAQAGLVVDEVLALDAITARPIVAPWFLPRLRAGGWIVFTRRPS